MPQQTVNLTLDGGIDQRTHERHVQPPQMLDALNVRYQKTGGAEKRPGCALYADATASGYVAGAGKLAAFKNELVLTDGYTIGSATTTTGSNTFTAKDKFPEAIPSTRSVTGTPDGGSELCVAYSSANGGFFVYAWNSNIDGNTGDVYVTVEDATTGAEILSSYRVSDGSGHIFRPRLTVCGSTVVVTYLSTSSTDIKYRIWDPVAHTWSTETAILNERGSSDYAIDATATNVYITYRSNANVTRVVKLSNAMAVQTLSSSSELLTDTNNFAVSATAGEHVWIAYTCTNGSNTEVRVNAFNDTLTTEQVTPKVVFTAATSSQRAARTALVRVSAARFGVLVSTITSTTYGRSTHAILFDATGTTVTSQTNRGTYWTWGASKPFVASTSPLRVCAWVYTGGARYDAPAAGEQSLQYTYTLVDLGFDDEVTSTLPLRPIAWVAPRYASEDIVGGPCAVVNVGSKWYCVARISRSNSGRTSFMRVCADFASSAALQCAELGNTIHFAPGFYWDRSRLSEIGFCYWPQKGSTPTFSAAGGHLVAGKTYRRRFVYEFTDANGNVHRSEPSDVLEFTVTTSNDSATYNIPALTMTTRADAATGFFPYVSIAVYGTQSTDVDGTTYYRVGTIKNTQAAPTESISFFDQGSLTLATQPTLYTDGGSLPNVQPSGFSAVVTYRNRLWIAYGNTVAYSKAYVTGEAVSFVDGFELPLEESGDVTALWVMDDTLFISTANRIYYLQAEGPTDTGSQNDVPTPSRVATDLGCIEPRSIVVTPAGTVYQSAVSLELLDRSRQVSPDPFGYKVKSELAAFPTVTSATVHPSGGYLMVTCAGTTGERLVYDYTQGRWSRDLLLTNAKVISTAVLNGTVYFLTSTGSVYNETSASYLDAGSWVTAKVKTSWLKAAGLQGYQWVHRAIWMGEKFTSHDLTISEYVDYASTPTHTWTWTATGGTTPLDSMPLPQVSLDPPAQRTQAVSFEIADATPTGASVGTGRGSSFVGLAVDLETEGNSWELPATQKG